MAEALEEFEPPVSPRSALDASLAHAPASAFSLSHLPPIKLPPFDEKHDDWASFRDRFHALIIENRDLNNFARMHFLQSCLKGRAADCVGDIAITGENFDVAWKALKARFESKRRLLNIHLASLLNLTAIPKESAADLISLRDKVNLAVASLKQLERSPAELWTDTLVYIISNQLDPITRKAWNVKSSDNDEPPSFADLMKFLDSRARALEDFSSCQSGKTSSKYSSENKVTAATASKSSPSACPLCKARHYFSVCSTFLKSSPNQRRDLVKVHKRCFNCLSHGHAIKDCKSNFSCRTCQQRHHSLLHLASDSSSNHESTTDASPASTSTDPPSPSTASETTVQSLSTLTKRSKSSVLLATAWITVGSAAGRSFMVRALLDQGFEITFVSERLAQNLRAKRVVMPVSISAVGCVHAGNFNKAMLISVSSRDSPSPSFRVTALIMKSLTSYSPQSVGDISSLTHLAELRWADPNPGSSDAIDVIIGADLFSDVILEGVRKGGVGEPLAQNSIFG
ncbi:hypothetical protein X777_09803 [Ooceraea biroi]|nr:hypothetical protein X777_09803 [Ooceraea biroi]